MKKLFLTCVFAVAIILTGCSNAAGGNPAGNNSGTGEIDYLARLIGTWQTTGYDNGDFIYLVHPSDPNQHCKIKAQWVFTDKTYTVSREIKESTITGVPDGVKNDSPKPLYGVDAKNYYTAEKLNNGTPHDGHPVNYEIKNGALYVVSVGPMYKQ